MWGWIHFYRVTFLLFSSVLSLHLWLGCCYYLYHQDGCAYAEGCWRLAALTSSVGSNASQLFDLKVPISYRSQDPMFWGGSWYSYLCHWVFVEPLWGFRTPLGTCQPKVNGSCTVANGLTPVSLLVPSPPWKKNLLVVLSWTILCGWRKPQIIRYLICWSLFLPII